MKALAIGVAIGYAGGALSVIAALLAASDVVHDNLHERPHFGGPREYKRTIDKALSPEEMFAILRDKPMAH